MPQNVAQKLISSHLVSGEMEPGAEIGIRIDHTLTQDATGTMVMLELEAMNLDYRRTDVSVQYVDHNLLQTDHRNADDHLFLRSACRRFGLWYSKPGNGISHAVHQQRFGKPGVTMIGSDSHTPAAGSLGMLAIGVGGARGRDGHRRRAAVHLDATDLGHRAHRRAAGVGQREGRHPRDAAPSRREGWRRADHRVPRARPLEPVGHGPPRHREHGRGARGRRPRSSPPTRRCAATWSASSGAPTTPSCSPTTTPPTTSPTQSTCPPSSR